MKKLRLKNKYKNLFSSFITPFFNFFRNISDFFRGINSNIARSRFVKNRRILKASAFIVVAIIMLMQSFSWMYDEYIGSGAVIAIGSIRHQVIQYDSSGEVIETDGDTQTMIYETNMSNITRNSKIIEIKNTGTLDLEYSLTFGVEGDIGQTGVLYYRLYEVTNEVLNSNLSAEHDTKVKAYTANNPIPNNIETDTINPITNLSLLKNVVEVGDINLEGNDSTSVYYRLDYGMYSSVNTALYSGKSLSAHLNVYSSQVGTITAENDVGQMWDVENEEQFRSAMKAAYPGDTIRLLSDITIDGTINFPKRINLDTNDCKLKITGDLVYDFVSLGDLKIDTSGAGILEVGNDFYINAPKAAVTIKGENKSYDIVVGNEMTVNGLQDGEEDGILLENVKIVKSTVTYIPVDIIVLSNTRLTLGPDVEVGFVKANPGSTNVEVINNGTITQLQFQEMTLLDSFTKAQIYVYNLGTIYGAVGSSGILLPANATPYLGSNQGNTLIIRGITSSDFTVSGSDNFDNDDVEENLEGSSVIPIDGETNAYYVYIKDATVSVQSLLAEYFTLRDENVNVRTAAIEKLVIYAINAQYFENEDFDFLNSSALPNLSYLSLANSKVTDGATANKIKDNAMIGKDSLRTLILPKTVSEIGSNAFSGISLGNIPADASEQFSFVTIPSSVTSIGDNAFGSSKYIKFSSSLAPEAISSTAFNTTENGAKFFVPAGAIETYQNVASLNSTNIFHTGELSDNRRYIVYENNSGIGISYIINNQLTTTSLGIPNTITLGGTDYPVNEIGSNAFRHLNIVNVSGVPVTLPSTVLNIDSYAFYGLNITTIGIDNVVYIGNYAFYNTKLDRIVANRLEEVGDHAFENTTANIVTFTDIEKIGSYAFASAPNLYEINFANVKYIGSYAFYDCKQVARVYFSGTSSIVVNNQEDIDITIGENAIFSNWGYYINNRLRVYVPDGTAPTGNTYLKLYKNKFGENQRYVYIRGTDIGSYTYMSVPAQLSNYTVRELTITTPSGSVYSGLEIISYQGADIDSLYDLPKSFEVNGSRKNVISIGEGAFTNSLVSNGVKLKIDNNFLIKIGPYAFSNFNINELIGDNVKEIDSRAFYNSGITSGVFSTLESVGDSAFDSCSNLYVLDLGTASTFGSSAVSNLPNLEQLFLRNETRSIDVEANSIENVGTDIGDRFRIYVPDSDVQLLYYKVLVSNYYDYIYPTGRIVGHYYYGAIDFDIGEYSIRQKNVTKSDGTTTNGWEIIEYHGPDLSSEYVLPEVLNPTIDDVDIEQTATACFGTYQCNMSIKITNNSSDNISTWELDMATPNGMRIEQYSNGNWEEHTDYVTILPTTTNASIAMGRSITVQLKISSLVSFNSVEFLGFRATMPNVSGLNIISVGQNAFSHTRSSSSATFDMSSTQMLNISNNAFMGLTGIKNITMDNVEYIGSGAFKDTSIAKGSFKNLKTLGQGAFQNVSTLYVLDLGTVHEMKENAISNAPNLLQVFFEMETLDLAFNNNAINNVGSTSNDRMRFYVTNGVNQDDERYVDIYKSYFKGEIQSYFFSYDYIIGSYTPAGVNDDVDIGEFSIREATVKNENNDNVTGYEYVEYHGVDLTSFFEFPLEFEFSDDSLSAQYNGLGNYWGSNGSYTGTFSFTITNVGTTTIDGWRLVIDMSSANGWSISNWWGSNATVDGDKLILLRSTYGEMAPGQSETVSGQLNFSSLDVAPYVRSVKKNSNSANALEVVSIGDNAFAHSKVASAMTFDIVSPNLLSIGNGAFQGNTGINKVSAENVVSIGNDAFRNATSFKHGYFPKLRTAGTDAFNNANNLSYLHLGEITNIPDGLLNNAKRITQLYILNENASATGELIMTVGSNSFTNTGINAGNKLRIYVPDGYINSTVSYVDAYKSLLPANVNPYVFANGYLSGSYYYEDTDIEIGEYMVREINIAGTVGWKIIDYHGPTIDTNYVFPSVLTANDQTAPVIAIGDYAFNYTEFDTTTLIDLEIANTVKEIGNYAFYQRPMLTVTNTSVTKIGKYAFAQIEGLESVEFSGVTSIDEYAFYRNEDLRAATLSDCLTEIGDYAFYNPYSSNKLVAIYLPTAVPPTIHSNSLPGVYSTYFTNWNDPTIYVPYTSISDYEDADYWEYYPITLIGSVYTTGRETWLYNITGTNTAEITGYVTNSSNVSIPNTIRANGGTTYRVTSISDNAFDAATNVRYITIPSNVVTLGTNFLANNTSVRLIYVESGNTTFKSQNNALYSYDGTTLIKYPPARTSTSYTLSSSTTVIISGAFANARNLRTISLNSGLLAISNNTFINCDNLTTLTFQGSTPPIVTGFNAFPDRESLTLNVPDSAINTYKNNMFFYKYGERIS